MRHSTNDVGLTAWFGRFPQSPVSAASAALLLCVLAPPAAAQAEAREVGTVTASGNVFWVRATNAGRVQLFMSRGYRDALARPSVLDAGHLAAWTDTARTLQRPSTGLAETRSGPLDDSGLVLDRWLAADSAGMRIQQNGTTVVRLNDTSARQLVALLAEASRVTQQLSGPPAVAAQQPVSTTVRAAPPAAMAARVTPVAAADTVALASMPTTAPAPAVFSISVPVEDTVPSLPVRTPQLQASIDRGIPMDAATASIGLSAARSPGTPSAFDAVPLPAPALADKHIQTPLGPFVVPGAQLTDHDTQINYCYTQLGLRYDRRLTGDVTVRVNLSGAGRPDTVEVTKRTWDGVAAAEVESCMRALIEDWSFAGDPDSKPTTIELHFTLVPSTGIRVAASGPDATPVGQPR